MNTFPTVLRMADIRLPVQLVTSGVVAPRLLDALENSSRFILVSSSPFQLIPDRNERRYKGLFTR